ncbi:MAG: dihydroorotate dehydrogenase electron transfer subunit [Fusobacteriaceae bacterium]
MFLENCLIMDNSSLGSDNYLLKIKSEKCIENSKPGQFFMLKCKNEITILRRPISLHYVNKKEKILEFYFETKGKGTREFSKLKKDDFIEIQGPLGQGFSTDLKNENILVIGGGMGIAPMKFTIETLAFNNNITFIAGARSKEYIKILDNFDLSNISTHIATDDGSYGTHGNVVQVLKSLLLMGKYDKILTCGPHKMMEAIYNVAKSENIKIEVSLEERMACGIKACVGCSIKTKNGMKKVCADGPVFSGYDVMEKDYLVSLDEVTLCCN